MVMKSPMAAFLIQLLLAIRSRFTRRARLEAENLSLRQQLIVLRRKSPTRVRLWNIDRLLDALATIKKALQMNENRPEVLTTRGELWLKTGQPELAEADFHDAIVLAQRMSAKAWELRATTSLARLLAKQGMRR